MTKDTYKPLDCGHYDILEIICMDAYDVEVITAGDTFAGVASTIEKRVDGEYLILKANEAEPTSIRADKIHKIDVQTRPCRFTTHEFPQA